MQRPDPIEKYMDTRVEDMTPSEMATYMKLYLSNRYNIDLPLDGIKERKTFEAFKKRYPNGVAGRILQWVMMHHGGRKDGQYITSSVFSAAMSWWTDKMYLELQTHEQTQTRCAAAEEPLRGAFLDSSHMV